MARILALHTPSDFTTLALHVEADAEHLIYKCLGQPLNFSQMLERRKPITISDPQHFAVELANLGVSVRLTLNWHGRDHWLVVRQRRSDRGDTVLKLISGYVPAHELHLPLLPALQEVAEECLIETAEGWLNGRFAETWLPTPYRGRLHYRNDCHFELTPLSGAARPVLCEQLTLQERPRAYVHLPTASLQLIYDLRLSLPKAARMPSLFHADERLEGEQLVARLERRRPDIYLLPLKQDQPTGELLQLQHGELRPVSSRGLWLSESFASQEGWLVRDERIRWQDWLQQIKQP